MAAARREMAAGDGCRSASMRSRSSGVRLASLPAIVQSTHERATVRRDAVPALPRGVGLGFDQARDAWVLLAPERVTMPDPIAVEILQRCDGKARVAAIIDDLAATFAAERSRIEADVNAFLDTRRQGHDRAGRALRAPPPPASRRQNRHSLSGWSTPRVSR